jgi:hypothetical protein
VTDRELLELAAKAAGLTIDKSPYNGGGTSNDGFDILGNAVLDWFNGTKWNPLTDDGDALRLAVRLRINIEHAETLGRKSHGVNCWPVGRGDCGHMENDLRDYGAATRRAITRAAAEIGRAML